MPKDTGDYQLAPLAGRKPPAPAWFEWAMAQEPEHGTIAVDGADIEMATWGETGKPGLLLIHGSRASTGWWDAIAPMLMRDFRVAAFSMSGMGNSGRRDSYTVRQYARETFAVAEAAGLFDSPVRPVIAAHSFGGYAGLHACHDHPGRFAGLALIDVIIRDIENRHQKWRMLDPEPVRVYPTLEDAIARFRLIPGRNVESLWALDAIARCGVRHDPELGGWTWKFDNALFARIEPEDLTGLIGVKTPLAIIRGEDSPLVDPVLRDLVARLFGDDVPDIVIPDAGHHIMADQPLALVTALRTLLAVWPEGGRRSVLGRTDPAPY